MNWVRILSVLPSILIALASATHLQKRPDAPDRALPFVRAPAQSVADLIREVQADPRALARYSRFFHIPPGKTIAFLQTTLRPGLLAGEGNYTAYFVSQTGRVYPVWLTLPAGAEVFLNTQGSPILLRNSGDPIMPVPKLSAPLFPQQNNDAAEARASD